MTAVNHVVIGGETKFDLRNDTVTPSNLAKGVTAHDASGNAITGELEPVKSVNNAFPDDNGNVTIGDYVSNIEISGKNVTVTFKDGTERTFTTQDTNTVPYDYVTETGSSGTAGSAGYQYYRRYKSGWQEVGGYINVTSTPTITYIRPFSHVPILTAGRNRGGTTNSGNTYYFTAYTATGFTCSQDSGQNVWWEARGKGS